MRDGLQSGHVWRGRAIFAVAVLHCAFVVLLGSGMLNDPKLEPYTGSGAAWSSLRPGFGLDFPPKLFLLSLFWSLFFGLALALVGLLVHELEIAATQVPRSFAGALLGIALTGGVLAPVSGFWFIGAIAIALLRRP